MSVLNLMASVSSHRAPGDSMSPTYYSDDEDLEHQDHLVRGYDLDGRTPVSFSAWRWVTILDSHGKYGSWIELLTG